jgi:dTDP-4-amino-4,6-dideoxygalactose transaminase
VVEPIEFIDLAAQRRRLGGRLEAAIGRVLDHGRFIMGPEVPVFEERLAAFCGARYALSCSNGTDALALALMGWGYGPGDAVFVPAFTFAATAETIAWVGATPVFVDVLEHSFNLDPASLEVAITDARQAGLRPACVVAVDLFGLPSDYDRIEALAQAESLRLLVDAAQSFGAYYGDRRVGSIGDAVATSFFPSKPLGCYGDGGAVLTDDEELLSVMRSLRVHGQGVDKYDNVRIGMNARLDTIQAAILIEKLAILEDEIAARQTVAARYHDGLADLVAVPIVPDGLRSVWAQYTIRLGAGCDRDAVQAALKEAGVPTMVYYPKPLHRLAAFHHYPRASTGLAVSERLAGEVLSLPMHPYLDRPTQQRIIDAVRVVLARSAT